MCGNWRVVVCQKRLMALRNENMRDTGQVRQDFFLGYKRFIDTFEEGERDDGGGGGTVDWLAG